MSAIRTRFSCNRCKLVRISWVTDPDRRRNEGHVDCDRCGHPVHGEILKPLHIRFEAWLTNRRSFYEEAYAAAEWLQEHIESCIDHDSDERATWFEEEGLKYDENLSNEENAEILINAWDEKDLRDRFDEEFERNVAYKHESNSEWARKNNRLTELKRKRNMLDRTCRNVCKRIKTDTENLEKWSAELEKLDAEIESCI